VEAVANSSEAITEPDVFDVYRSLLKHAHAVTGPVMSKLLDSISSGLHAQVEATLRDTEHEDQQTYMAHKTPLEMYAFLLHWFVSAAERVRGGTEEDGAPVAPAPRVRRGRGAKAATAGRGAAAKRNDSWTWIDQIPATLALISRVMRLKTHRVWSTAIERDTFITYVFRSDLVVDCVSQEVQGASLAPRITSPRTSST
jgi:condensin complex subunit 1